ncbi:MAG: hypothetical protein ACD_79C00456G0003 [uncultured bacterium]|nr:MAG: hypothetical protein ACD_79C00456G0003 [uncultured bacterium]
MMIHILKKIGELFIYKKNVIILVTCICGLTFAVFFITLKKYVKLQNYKNKLTYLSTLSVKSIDMRKKTNNFIERFAKYDKFFIDNNLECLKFLQNEKNILEKLLQHPAFCNNSQIKQRIDFINSEQNTLKFVEENVAQTPLLKETDENQLYAIEIDEKDLTNILSIIESSQSENSSNDLNAPQLIIKNFVLNKEKENTFLLNLKILKREFNKK